MEELRALVRGYCGLQDEQRESSIVADSIKQMTGYAMPGSVTAAAIVEGNAESSSTDILANRRSVFLKISPAMMEMEKQKHLDIKKWENDTGCRVEKSTKSGKYKYYTIENRQRVGSQEYKRRYMAVLEGSGPMREAKAQLWMNLLRESDAIASSSTPREQNSEPILPIEQGKCAESLSSIEEKTDFVDRVAFGDPQAAAEHERQQREAFRPPMSTLEKEENFGSQEDVGDAMDVCDHQAPRSFSTPMDTHREGEPESASADIVEVSSEDAVDSDIRRASSSPSPLPLEAKQSSMECNLKEQEAAGPILVAQSRDEGADESSGDPLFSTRTAEESDEAPLLPLPSRDSESLDPNIATAERHLWKKIDRALKEYSEEVMVIMKAKESGKREPVGADNVS
ncbi:MAG: hypothetical protein SGARI_001305 [Bacillariaceae sp.]